MRAHAAVIVQAYEALHPEVGMRDTLHATTCPIVGYVFTTTHGWELGIRHTLIHAWKEGTTPSRKAILDEVVILFRPKR